MFNTIFKNKRKNNNSLSNEIVKQYNKTRHYNKNKLCYAPFKSLTFFLAGDIMACWHNKQYLLGHYPEDNIKEIWFGEKLNKLREHINSNDLTCGCEECEKHIKSGNFNSAGSWRYDYLSVKTSEYPVSFDFQISNICNLECIMCNGEYSISVRQNRELKQPYNNPYDDSFIKQLEPFIPYLQEASFSGGESFIIDQYYSIWEKIYEINPNVIISVTTNGSILNERAKNILEKLKFNITLSIDSANKTNYEYIRKNAHFENLLANIEFYKQYTTKNNTSLTVRACPIQQNWKELPELFNFINNQNIKLFFNTVIFPPYSSLWNLSSTQLNEILIFLTQQSFITDTNVQKENFINYKNLLEQINNWHSEAIKREIKYPEIDQFHSDELKTILFNNVKSYLKNNNSFNENKKQEFILFFENVITLCEKEITEINVFNNALKYYLGFPINRLIDEFNIRNTEKILNLTKQAGKSFVK